MGEGMSSFAGIGEAAVIDCETIGLDPGTDRIITVAVIRADFTQLDRGTSLTGDSLVAEVNPGVPIPESATAVHGLRIADTWPARIGGTQPHPPYMRPYGPRKAAKRLLGSAFPSTGRGGRAGPSPPHHEGRGGTEGGPRCARAPVAATCLTGLPPVRDGARSRRRAGRNVRHAGARCA